MTRLILFPIRIKLGVKTCEPFRFDNQKTDNWYFIDDEAVWKLTDKTYHIKMSNVGINWLLNRKCKIIRERDIT